MKTIITFCLVFTSFFSFLFSQDIKGVSPIDQKTVENGGTTRAVVVGISDYQNSKIPDLRFADRDAEAFAQYLRSDAGGNLDDDHLKLLINKKATWGQIATTLDWLLDESEEGDKAIIYFSGHGDVEVKYHSQPGFLLPWDSPPRTYVAGALPISHLQIIISSLSLEKKAKVIVITDACRSGKLAGSEFNGSQLTTANLANQFANEIKILSCQPNEYSIEGEQWGGGRGAFSYHLVEGLYGMADKNTDLQVTLSEIDRYLEDRVTPEVAPVSQMPMTVGLKSEKIANVNEALLANIKAGKAGKIATISKVESKGIEEEVLASVDSTIRQQFLAWKTAMANKQFFKPEGRCADDLYNLLVQEPSLSMLHNHMKRNYAAALQDDAQQMLNDYLYASHKEFDLPWQVRLERYSRFVKQLETAIKLLGENHYMYNSLMGRKLFIDGKRQEQQAQMKGDTKENQDNRIHLYMQSLEYEPNAAYIFLNLAGVAILGKTKEDYDKAIEYGNKGIELSPNWAALYNQKANIYRQMNQVKKAEAMWKKGMEVDSNSVLIQERWGKYNQRQGNFEEAEKAYKKAIALDSTHDKSYEFLGVFYQISNKYAEAEKLYKKANELNPTSDRMYIFLGQIYVKTNKYAEAEKIYKKYIELRPTSYEPYFILGQFYQRVNKYNEAEEMYKKAIELNSTFIWAYTRLGQLYENTNKYAEAEKVYIKAIELDSTSSWGYANLIDVYSQSGSDSSLKKVILKLERLLESIKFYSQAQELVVFVDLAYAYTNIKEYQNAIKYFQKALDLNEDDPWSNYHFVCFYSLQNKNEEALEWFGRALEKGFDDYNHIQTDSDIDSIRNTSKFQELMKKYFPDQEKN